jgi:hypothetical protein
MSDDSDSIKAAAAAYESVHVKKTVWGECSQCDGGGWLTTWTLQMDTSRVRSSNVDVVYERQVGFKSWLVVVDPGESRLLVKTRESPMSAQYYPLTFKSFWIVNDSVGGIATIQGLPGDWYAPFRSRITQ